MLIIFDRIIEIIGNYVIFALFEFLDYLLIIAYYLLIICVRLFVHYFYITWGLFVLDV